MPNTRRSTNSSPDPRSEIGIVCAHWLVDSVTLQHFGAVDSLSVLQGFLDGSEPPYWTDAVKSEVLAGLGIPRCDAVLSAAWLGVTAEVPSSEIAEIFKIQIALGGGGESGLDHLGEAESIHLADKTHGGVITDDNNAHDFVVRKFGPSRAMDTIGVLRGCVKAGSMDPHEAKLLADAMTNAGRHFLAVHPKTLVIDDFG